MIADLSIFFDILDPETDNIQKLDECADVQRQPKDMQMPDRQDKGAKAPVTQPVTDVATPFVVATAIDAQSQQCDLDLLEKLRAATLGAERADCKAAVADALQIGLSREDLADHYIPALAREMGDQWCRNQMGFAAVTIGVSRLQSMLRDLGPNWSGDTSAHPNAPSVMLIVGPDVYHTLGAMVLAGQLRRKGLSVRLMLGARPEELAIQLDRLDYQAVFISSSIGETLGSIRKIVGQVRISAKNRPPVVIGGTIIDAEGCANVMAQTGADYATNCVDDALVLCGLAARLLHEPQPIRGS